MAIRPGRWLVQAVSVLRRRMQSIQDRWRRGCGKQIFCGAGLRGDRVNLAVAIEVTFVHDAEAVRRLRSRFEGSFDIRG